MCNCYRPGVRHGNPVRPKKLLRDRRRKYQLDRLYALVRSWIEQHRQQKRRSFFKEEIAAQLKAHEYQVEIVLRQLNREGLISQAQHDPDQDSHRHRRYMNWWWSAWNGDIYYIRESESA